MTKVSFFIVRNIRHVFRPRAVGNYPRMTGFQLLRILHVVKDGRAQSQGLGEHTTTSTATSDSQPKISILDYLREISPLISGTFGPVSVLMALSGCIDHWRIISLPDGSKVIDADPLWVIIPTSIAIMLGAVANSFLLLRLLNGKAVSRDYMLYSSVFWFLEGEA